MFSKEEVKRIKLDFWTRLNEQLELEKGVHGNKVNWMNFNTKIKHLYFRMEADENSARLCIDLQFPDEGIRELYYEQFTEFQNLLNDTFDATVNWVPTYKHSNGKMISRVYVEQMDVNIFNRDTWSIMHTFLIQHFVQLEAFWAEFGEVFVSLKN